MTLNGQIIGQAERATRTLLDRHLRTTGLAFEDWVAVNQVHAGAGGRQLLVARLVRGLKIDDEAAERAVDRVVEAGLVAGNDARLTLTDVGLDTYARVSGEIAAITARLYDGVAPEDLAVAGRVLTLVTARADAELVAAST